LFYSRQKATHLIITCAVILSACSAAPSLTSPPPPPEPQPTWTASLSQDEPGAWSEDLDFFMVQLREKHPNPFYRVSEEEYQQAINNLKAQLPTLTDEQITVELTRIVAFIDGHSMVNTLGEPVNFHHYPLRLFLFSNGLFIIGAPEPYGNKVGGKIIQIGNASIAEAMDAVSSLIPHDNPMTIQLGLPSWLMRPEVLMALGIIKSMESPQIVIELANGSQQTINPSPLTWDVYREWARGDAFGNGPVFGLPQLPKPLYLSHAFSDDYWFTYLEESGTLYIQYNRVQSGINTMVNEIREFLEQQEVERVVLDLRLNPGGNNTTYRGFLTLLTTDERINRPGHFFTIIGRQTFSAATNFATELDNLTHTIFVGEPTGGSPNLYGDVAPITLPNSKIQIFISARYWEKSTPEDERIWIEPDLPAPLSSDDFFNNVDPAMEAILSFDLNKGYTPAYNPILMPNIKSDWEATDVRDPYVVENDGMYYMFHAGQDSNGIPSIGYTTSQNGKKWFRAGENPVLTGSREGFDRYGVTAPVIHKEGDVWAMYYAAIPQPGERPTSIGRAVASRLDGPWERSDVPILIAGEPLEWDSLSITPGSVVDVNGRMRLYYSGFAANQEIGIGYAESTDGITWVKHGDPVLPGGGFGDWDEIVYAPFVQIRDGVWEMYYHGDPFSSRETNDIGLGLATSTDGITWVRPGKPFLVSEDESRFLHTPAVLQIGDYIYVYFSSLLKEGGVGRIEFHVFHNLR